MILILLAFMAGAFLGIGLMACFCAAGRADERAYKGDEE